MEHENADLIAALSAINAILHIPTSKTPHKRAYDHFGSDCDQIRAICARFLKMAASQGSPPGAGAP